MSLLDSFFIQFTTNAKDVRKDTADAKKATDEFQKQLNQADESTAKLGLSFSKLALAGVEALAAFSALGKLKDAIVGAVDFNAQIEKTSKLTGISARELAVWNGVVAQAGGNPNSKEFLNFITGKNQQYAGLGINQRTRFIIRDLGEIADKIKQLNDNSPGSGYALAQKLGLGDDLYLALVNGKSGLQGLIDQQERLNSITDESASASLELKKQWQGLGQEFQSVWTNLIPFAQFFSSVIGVWIKGFRILSGLAESIWNLHINPDLKRMFDQDFGSGTASPTSAASVLASDSNSPRGIRNNNPGNLRYAGQAGAVNNGGFAQFYNLGAGLSAEQRQLQIYGQRGIDTLAAIATKWAPSGENNTAAYIAGLSKSTGYGANQRLDLSDPKVRSMIANAINIQEEGQKYGALITGAQTSIAAADGSSLNNAAGGSQKTLNIGTITIQTQATDAEGIASALHGSLNQHFATTIGAYDDGVLY